MPTDATRAKELAGLIERLEAATGPDREIDSAVFAACGMHINPRPSSFEYGRWPDETADGSAFYRIDRITTSIDAALALVERMLPTALWQLEPDTCWIRVPTANDVAEYQGGYLAGGGKLSALAICLALLRALAGEDAQG